MIIATAGAPLPESASFRTEMKHKLGFVDILDTEKIVVANIALIILALSLAALWLSTRERRQLDAEEGRLRDLADIAIEGLMICDGSMPPQLILYIWIVPMFTHRDIILIER